MPRFILRPIRTLLGVLLLAGTVSCSRKDSDFFTYSDSGFTGGIHVVVNGIPGGAPVTLNGEVGLLGTHVVDLSGYRFAPLLGGTYTVSIAVPMGFVCDKTSQDLSYDASNTDAEVAFLCMETPGTVSFTSTGITGSTSFGLSLMDGTTLNGSLTSSGATFMNVHPGHWTWSLGSTTGFTCMPTDGAFDLAAGGTFTQMIDCQSDLGGLLVAVTGTGMTHTVGYSGPENGSVQAGETPVTVSVMPGDYLLSLTAPDGYTCPSTQSATVSAGQTASVTFACTPQPGTVNVTVSGATADVSYTGPSSGMVSAGSTPVPVTGLAAGSYTFTITDPSGFSCTPASIPVTLAPGGTESADFSCTSTGGGLPTTVGIDLTNFQGSAGAVPAGTYTRPLLDGATPVGTVDLSTIGAQTFYGTSPFRLGSGANSGWRIQLGISVNSQPYSVSGVAVCVLNTTLDASHTMDLTYRDGALASLGVDHVDTAPSCFWGTVPGGTMYIDVTGPNDRFIDINGLQLWH